MFTSERRGIFPGATKNRTMKIFKKESEVRNHIRESGKDFSAFAEAITLLPLGTEMKWFSVKGKKIDHYAVKENDTGIGPSHNVYYIAEDGSKMGIGRENDMHK